MSQVTRQQTLLVTGFGPFPGMPRNPSAALAGRVAASPRWRILGVQTRARVLTSAYAALAAELDPELATGPDAVLMIGVAGRATRVRVETRATSRRSTLYPDAAGETARRAALGSGTRRATLPPAKALLALKREDLPARSSRDAGRYLCNASYYRALACPAVVMFIHIPKGPPWGSVGRSVARQRRTWDERLTDGLVAVAVELLKESRKHRRVVSRAPVG